MEQRFDFENRNGDRVNGWGRPSVTWLKGKHASLNIQDVFTQRETLIDDKEKERERERERYIDNNQTDF